MQRTLHQLFWATAFLIGTHTAQAQLIQQFNFTGAAGNEATLQPDGQPANGVIGSISRGSGISASSGANTFAASGFTTSATPDPDDYFQFSIQANTGYVLNLDSVVVSERRSNTGIRKFAVRSSLDNFTSDLTVFSVPDDANYRTNQQVALGTSFKNIPSGTNVEFRYLGYESESAAGTWRLDSIRIYGTILDQATSVSALYSKAKFNVYPNPGSYNLVIESATSEPIRISVFDAMGKVITTEKSAVATTILHTNAWKPGVYFVKVNNETLRWIKQ